MSNPAREGIDAVIDENEERRIFGNQYDNYQDLLGGFEIQLDDLIEYYQTRALADYTPTEQTRRINWQCKKILKNKSDNLNWVL